jgi:hypothetical protein
VRWSKVDFKRKQLGTLTAQGPYDLRLERIGETNEWRIMSNAPVLTLPSPRRMQRKAKK